MIDKSFSLMVNKTDIVVIGFIFSVAFAYASFKLLCCELY